MSEKINFSSFDDPSFHKDTLPIQTVELTPAEKYYAEQFERQNQEEQEKQKNDTIRMLKSLKEEEKNIPVLSSRDEITPKKNIP